jgi:alpha-1,2-mannosyltransferase
VLATAVLAATLAGWWRVLFGTTDPYNFFDLDFYRRSLDAVANGGLLYDSLAYPPVTMILLSPLRGLPMLAGNMLWTGLSLLTAVGLAVGLAHLTTPVLAQGSRTRTTFVARAALAATLLLASFPMYSQLINGQLSLLVLALVFVDATGLLPRKLQGSLVGVAAALKLTPLIFLPYYVITRQWRQLVNAVVSFGVTTAIGFVLFPRDSAYFWLHVNSSDVQGPTRRDNVTLLGLLRRWWPDASQAQVLWLVLAAVVGLLALYRARRHFLGGEQPQAALVVGVASTVVAPIAWPHYQVWIALAALWMLFAGGRSTRLKGGYAYLVFALPIPLAASAMYEASTFWRVVWELLVVVPTVICVLGLPRSPDTPHDSPAHGSAAGATEPLPERPGAGTGR